MFIILLTYKKSLVEVDEYVHAHRTYLDAEYAVGNFIASGPRNPRVGGVILCKAKTKEEVQEIISKDPFHQHKIASYEIIEFEPTKYISGFAEFLV